jgi:hypothetical protein
MTRITLPLTVVTVPCQGTNVDMFGGGKHQRAAARAVCAPCPKRARDTCTRIAESLQVLGKQGEIVDGATGTFGGKSWKMGVIID